MYFKINVASKLPPGKLLIIYGNNQYTKSIGAAETWTKKKRQPKGKLIDLRICYSNANILEPTENNCTKYIQNPQRSFPLSASQGRETYDYDWLYLSMFSISGCTFMANILFKDEERNVVKRRLKTTND